MAGRSLNKVMLIGNLGKDPEVRYTSGGQAVANLRIATSRSWTDKASGQKKEETEWHDVEVWGKQAEQVGEYLAKGRQVYVEGRLKTDSWDDKQTGQKKYMTNIVGQDIGETGGFAVFSLNAGYRPKKGVLFAGGVDNLFNRTYAEAISRAGTMISGFDQTTRVNEPGRTLWLKAQIALD